VRGKFRIDVVAFKLIVSEDVDAEADAVANQAPTYYYGLADVNHHQKYTVKVVVRGGSERPGWWKLFCEAEQDLTVNKRSNYHHVKDLRLILEKGDDVFKIFKIPSHTEDDDKFFAELEETQSLAFHELKVEDDGDFRDTIRDLLGRDNHLVESNKTLGTRLEADAKAGGGDDDDLNVYKLPTPDNEIITVLERMGTRPTGSSRQLLFMKQLRQNNYHWKARDGVHGVGDFNHLDDDGVGGGGGLDVNQFIDDLIADEIATSSPSESGSGSGSGSDSGSNSGAGFFNYGGLV